MITFINPLIKQDHDEPNEAIVLFLAKDTTVAKASIRLRSRLACALWEHSARYILTPEFKSALIATTGTTCALCSKLWSWAKSGLHYIFIQIQEIYSMFISFFKIEVTKNMRGFNKKKKQRYQDLPCPWERVSRLDRRKTTKNTAFFIIFSCSLSLSLFLYTRICRMLGPWKT